MKKTIFIILLSMIYLNSCTSDNKQQIIGNWSCSDGRVWEITDDKLKVIKNNEVILDSDISIVYEKHPDHDLILKIPMGNKLTSTMIKLDDKDENYMFIYLGGKLEECKKIK